MAPATNKSRDLAILEGKATYFTGQPCIYGHLSERYVKGHLCIECHHTIHKDNDRTKYRNSDNTLLIQFNQRRNIAKKHGIPFTIDYDEIEQPEFCPVLGLKLNYKWGGVTGRNRDPSKATLDRVIPELGYVKGNVFVISWRANRLKNNMSIDELEKILNYIKGIKHG